ncbi:MAG: hypothetical protein FWG90_09790 [Oscillospiraceae bacterium]|nr:hypothetical protein [Oscillospiraceae bacterium]
MVRKQKTKKLLALVTATALAISVMAFAPLMTSAANTVDNNVYEITESAAIESDGNISGLTDIAPNFTMNVSGGGTILHDIQNIKVAGEIVLTDGAKINASTIFTEQPSANVTVTITLGENGWDGGNGFIGETISGVGTVEFGGRDNPFVNADITIESRSEIECLFSGGRSYGNFIIEEDANLTLSAGTISIATGKALTNNGTFNINGDIWDGGTITNTATGTIHVNSGGTLSTGTDCVINNSGTIISKATFSNGGTINNQGANSEIIIESGTFSSTATSVINNEGKIELNVNFTNNGEINNIGTAGELLIVDCDFTNAAGKTITNGGDILIDSSSMRSLSFMANHGTITNNGVLTVCGVFLNYPTGITTNNKAIVIADEAYFNNDGVLTNETANSTITIGVDSVLLNVGTLALNAGRLINNGLFQGVGTTIGSSATAAVLENKGVFLTRGTTLMNGRIDNSGRIVVVQLDPSQALTVVKGVINNNPGGELLVGWDNPWGTYEGAINLAAGTKIVHKGERITVLEDSSITGEGIIERWDRAEINDEFDGIEVKIVNMRTTASDEPEQTAPATGGSPIANIISGGGIGGGSGGSGGGRETEVITDKAQAVKAVSEMSRGTVTLSPSIGATAEALQALAVANSNVKVWIPHGNHGVAIKGADIKGGAALKDLNFAGGLTTVSEGLAARFPQASAITGMRFAESGDFGAVESVTLSVKLNIDPKLWGRKVAVYSVNADGSLTRLPASRIVSGNGMVSVTISNYNSLIFVVE